MSSYVCCKKFEPADGRCILGGPRIFLQYCVTFYGDRYLYDIRKHVFLMSSVSGSNYRRKQLVSFCNASRCRTFGNTATEL